MPAIIQNIQEPYLAKSLPNIPNPSPKIPIVPGKNN
jgi:hypothetical protein